LTQLIEEKKTPENAEKAVGIPQRKGDAQADIADGVNRERVGDGPEASGEKRPNDEVRGAANIGADRRGAEDEGRQALASEKNTNDHDQRNDHRGNSDGDEFGGRFGGAKPCSRGEAGEDTEPLEFFGSRGVRDCWRSYGGNDGWHFSPV
jgi:hypothetical protein